VNPPDVEESTVKPLPSNVAVTVILPAIVSVNLLAAVEEVPTTLLKLL
jgi:hypothetical protein